MSRNISVLMVMLSFSLPARELRVSGNLRKISELLRRAAGFNVTYRTIEYVPLKSLDASLSDYEAFTLKKGRTIAHSFIHLLLLSNTIRRQRYIDLELSPDVIPEGVLGAFFVSRVIGKPCAVAIQLLPSWLLGVKKATLFALYGHFKKSKGVLRAPTYSIAGWGFVWILLLSNLIFSSEAYRHMFVDIVGRRGTSFVNPHTCGIDVPELGAHSKDIDAVFVGTHDERKGIFDLVRVWSEVSKRNPLAWLVTCGYIRPEVWQELSRQIKEQALVDARFSQRCCRKV
jgi:glycosyltransferase involved in cell wall biosynthesis